MQSCLELPQNYRPVLNIDLQKDKKLALLVNGLAIVIAVVLLIPGNMAVPAARLFDVEDGMGVYFARLAVLLVGMVVYMVLHELVHGIFMRHYSHAKVRYGFTGLYAFAGSDAYYAKVPYIVIALAPVVVWGLVLAVLCAVAPAGWFWVAYFIQIINLSGAAADLYVTVKFCTLPKDILVRDTGTAMTVYAPQA